MAMDKVLLLVKPDLAGLRTDRVNAIAYADKLFIFTENEARMRDKLVAIRAVLSSSSMTVKRLKSRSLTLKGFRKQKTSVLDAVEYVFGGEKVTCVRPTDSFEYLGLKFNWKRVERSPLEGKLAGWLGDVTRAPLKPQRRVVILRHYILTKLSHYLELCNIHKKCLQTDATLLVKVGLGYF